MKNVLISILKPKVELRARPKVKMKIAFTKEQGVLKSPYYLCNKGRSQNSKDVVTNLPLKSATSGN